MGVCVRWCRLFPTYLKRYWIMIAWCIAASLMFYFEYYRYKREPQYYYLRTMLGLGLCFSRGSAGILNLCSCLLVLPMCRRLTTSLSTLVTSIRITPQDNPPGLPAHLLAPATHHAKSTHLMLAFTLVLASVMHTGSHIANAINFSRHYSNRFPNLNQFSQRGENPAWFFITTLPGVTGVLMILILVILVVSSSRWARRRNYDAFYYTHTLGVVFLVLMLLHPLSGCLKEQSNITSHHPGCRPMHNASRQHKDNKLKPMKNFTFSLSSVMTSPQKTSNNQKNKLSYEPEAFPEPVAFPEPEAFPEPHYEILEYTEAFPEPAPSILIDKVTAMKQPAETNMDEKRMTKTKDAEADWKRKRKKKKRNCQGVAIFVPMNSTTWRWVTFALVIWSCDWLLRWWRRKDPVEIVAVLKHPGCDVTELTLKQEGFSCHPGQFILLQCPQVSRLEWHPFTVTSINSAGPGTFSIYMRTRGDWTSQVGTRLRPLTIKKHVPNYKPDHKFHTNIADPAPSGYVHRLPQNRCSSCQCVHSPNKLNSHCDIHHIYDEIPPKKDIINENLSTNENLRKGKLAKRRSSYNDIYSDKMCPKWHYPKSRRFSLSSSPTYISNQHSRRLSVSSSPPFIPNEHSRRLSVSSSPPFIPNHHSRRLSISSSPPFIPNQHTLIHPSFKTPSSNQYSLPTPHHSLPLNSSSSHSFMSQPLYSQQMPVTHCHLENSTVNRNRKIIYDKRLSRNIFYNDNEKKSVNDCDRVRNSSYGSVVGNCRDTTEHVRATIEENEVTKEKGRNCDIDIKGTNQVFNSQHTYNKEHVIHVRSPVNISIYVDGPFSSPSSSMLSYPVVIGAAGGVGITPLAAMLNHILMNSSNSGFVGPSRIHVVWVARDARLFLSLAPLLVGLLQQCWEKQKEDALELRLHLTTPTPQPILKALFVGQNSILLPRIVDGRPQWKQIFKDWRTQYTGTSVGVFACGPKKMCRQVKRHCLQAISLGAKEFSYHQESFS